MTTRPTDQIEAPGTAAPGPGPDESCRTRPIIYACSGCSDAGELADRTARTLSQLQLGEMSCLAGIGGRVKSLVSKASQAEAILVIDGCPLNCARRTLELAGISGFKHLELHRLGFRKGACPPTPERIAIAVNAGSAVIQASHPAASL